MAYPNHHEYLTLNVHSMKSNLQLLLITVFLISSCGKKSEPIPAAHTVPIVTTNPITNATNTTAVCGGVIVNNGGSAIIAEGVVWTNLLSDPTIDGYSTGNSNGTLTYFPKTSNGTANSFTSDLTGLNVGSTYFVVAYATNSLGTGYGAPVKFSPPYDY